MTSRLAELRAALMLLTRLPVWPGEAPPALSRALWAFPPAGLAVGAVAALVWSAAVALGLPGAMSAILAVTALAMATGGLHEDGLADCADGFWGGRDPARRLEIMRDSRIGSYGALALVLSLALRVSGMVAAGAGAGLAMLVLSGTSRAAPAVLLAALPPARSDGLGRRAAGGPGEALPGALIAAGLGGLCLLPLGVATALAVAMAMVGAVTVLALIARARIGGQTGDVLGAGQQIAEIAGWITIAALV